MRLYLNGKKKIYKIKNGVLPSPNQVLRSGENQSFWYGIKLLLQLSGIPLHLANLGVKILIGLRFSLEVELRFLDIL